MDQVLIIALSIIIFVGIALAIAWFSFGVWYTANRGPGRAQTRWRIYNRTQRKLNNFRLRNNPPVILQIDDMSLDMALNFDARDRRRRRKHGESDT